MSLVNKHESKAIRVSVEKRWEDQGKPQTSRTTMVIRPGDSAKRTLGCSAAKGQGGVIRSFTWVVVQAEWLE
jgi:hypothetical protein